MCFKLQEKRYVANIVFYKFSLYKPVNRCQMLSAMPHDAHAHHISVFVESARQTTPESRHLSLCNTR